MEQLTALRGYICGDFDPLDDDELNEFDVILTSTYDRKPTATIRGRQAALQYAISLCEKRHSWTRFEHNDGQVYPKGQVFGDVYALVVPAKKRF